MVGFKAYIYIYILIYLYYDVVFQLGIIVKEKNLFLHMDGARIFNAAIHLEVPISQVVEHCDSVTFCLSKGLAAPIGSILAGNKIFIEK